MLNTHIIIIICVVMPMANDVPKRLIHVLNTGHAQCAVLRKSATATIAQSVSAHRTRIKERCGVRYNPKLRGGGEEGGLWLLLVATLILTSRGRGSLVSCLLLLLLLH